MKEIEEIYQQMRDVYTEKTGFAVDNLSDMAVRLYAAAAQIQSLYAYADWTVRQCFPQTATGEYLDMHAQLRGIERKTGTPAQGTLRFRVDQANDSDIVIEQGTVCTTSGLVRFVTTGDAVIHAGTLYADAPAVCEQNGSAGNTQTQTVSFLTKAPMYVTGVMNPAPFSGGSDAEDDEALRKRVISSFCRLPNGANAAFYEMRAMNHPGVAAVSVLPRYQGIGTVGVVLASEQGVPNAALIEEVQEDLDAVREIAVDVSVMAPTVHTVNVRLCITPEDGVSFDRASGAVEAALEQEFSGKMLAKPVYRAALINRVFATGMVKNCVLLQPNADIEADGRGLPVLGSCEVTEE